MFGSKHESFENMALSVSSQYGLNLQQVKDTFSNREDTLRGFFNAASKAEHRRTGYGLATVFLGAVAAASALTLIVPAISGTAGVYTGYKTYKADEQLKWVGSQIKAEIDKKNSAPAAASPSAPANG